MKKITAKQLKRKMDLFKIKPIQIDTPSRFREGHLLGAVNISYSDKDFIRKISKRVENRNEEVVICCHPSESKQVDIIAHALEKAGYNHVFGISLDNSELVNSGLSIEGTSKS